MNILLAAINAKYIHSNLAVYCLKAYAEKRLAAEGYMPFSAAGASPPAGEEPLSSGEVRLSSEGGDMALHERARVSPAGEGEASAAAGRGENAPRIGIAEYTINQQADEILRDIYRRKPDLLCISCYIWNLPYVEELARELPKVLPDTVIWLGGPEVSYDARDVLRRLPGVTGVMRGEGEQTFYELIRYYMEGEKGRNGLADILGITYREAAEAGVGFPETVAEVRSRAGAAAIRETPWRDAMDLSEVPFVYEDLDLFAHKILYYESSRGCPFSCSYCLSSVDKCLRFRSLELVERELQFFLDRKAAQVKFVDRTFNCRHDHAKAVWRYLLEHDNGVTNFHFEIAADLLDEEELELLGRMRPGLVQLEIGVQSTNPDTIREIHRTMCFGQVAEKVRRIHAGGNVHQHLDLIAGLPFEDYGSFGRSFDDVYALEPEQLQLGFLKVLKGSDMEKNRARYGLVCKEAPPYEVLCTRWLPYGDVIRLKGIEEMVEQYYNSGQFRHTLPWLIRQFSGPFAFFEALSAYYAAGGRAGVSQARSARYEILLDFAGEACPGMQEAVRQLLTLDYYLRENARSRPAFAGEERLPRQWRRDFYEQEDRERRFLRGYEDYDGRSLSRMTHIEEFSRDVLGQLESGCFRILFDYRRRDPLTGEAAVYRLE